MRLYAKCKSKQWAPPLRDMLRLIIFTFPAFNDLTFNSQAIGRLVTPSTLQVIAMNLVSVVTAGTARTDD